MPNREQKEEAGTKYDGGKIRYDLINPYALHSLAQVYTYGAGKYGDRNYSKGISWLRIFGAIMRHLWAWRRGEDIDPESGHPHVAHAMWGCATLLEFSQTKKDKDDRC